MPFFDNFDRYMFNRMNDFFRGDYDEPMLLTGDVDNAGKEVAVPGSRRGGTFLSAKLDMVEQPNEFRVSVDLPGVKKEDIQVHVENGMLSVAAERREEKQSDGKDARYHYAERRYGSIKRVVSLPEGADAEKVKASFEDGVLTLDFAKKAGGASRKQIAIA